MNVISFCAMEGSEIIGYAGVVSWPINVKDESFKMCGLSCVCTHPEYRKRGIIHLSCSSLLNTSLFFCKDRAFIKGFCYLCRSFGFTSPESVGDEWWKRESGANPEQTRCCKSFQNLWIFYKPLSARRMGRHSKRDKSEDLPRQHSFSAFGD